MQLRSPLVAPGCDQGPTAAIHLTLYHMVFASSPSLIFRSLLGDMFPPGLCSALCDSSRLANMVRSAYLQTTLAISSEDIIKRMANTNGDRNDTTCSVVYKFFRGINPVPPDCESASPREPFAHSSRTVYCTLVIPSASQFRILCPSLAPSTLTHVALFPIPPKIPPQVSVVHGQPTHGSVRSRQRGHVTSLTSQGSGEGQT